jgi:DeoR/GlpR family transcriptional regulator of sugar metabolism
MADSETGANGGSARPAGKMGPLRRQEQVAEYVLQNGPVSARDLASMFSVSTMTIHRDLDELEHQGVLRKVRGAAEPQPTSLFESNVRYRLRASRVEKEAICQVALRHIKPGQSVMFDDSTTSLPMVRRLPEVTPLTVITPFLMTINELRGVKGINLTSLGGEYLASNDSFVGIACEATIASLRADVVFMSCPAVSECSAMHQEQDIVRIKRAMMAAAKRKILLVDHHKLGKTALHLLAPLSDFDLMIVDAGVDDETLDGLRDCGVPIEVAPL